MSLQNRLKAATFSLLNDADDHTARLTIPLLVVALAVTASKLPLGLEPVDFRVPMILSLSLITSDFVHDAVDSHLEDHPNVSENSSVPGFVGGLTFVALASIITLAPGNTRAYVFLIATLTGAAFFYSIRLRNELKGHEDLQNATTLLQRLRIYLGFYSMNIHYTTIISVLFIYDAVFIAAGLLNVFHYLQYVLLG